MTWIQYWDGFENPDGGDMWALGGTFYLGSFETTGGRSGGAVRLGDTHQTCTLSGYEPIPAYQFGFAVKPEGFTQPRKLCRWWVGCNFDEHDWHPAGGVLVTATGQLAFAVSTVVWPGQDDLSTMKYFLAPLRAGVWQHVELRVEPSTIKFWLDGVLLGKFTRDVLNMQYLFYPVGEKQHIPDWPLKRFQFGGVTTWQRQDSPSIWFDDFYIANYESDEGNVGDLAVKSYMPKADGTYTDWSVSASPAGSHYAMVDEDPHDSDATFVYAAEASVGDKDSYYFDIPESDSVPLCVQPMIAVRKTNIGVRMMQIFQRINSSPAAEDLNFSGPFYIYTVWPSEYKYHPFGLMEWFDFSFDAHGDPWTRANLIDTEFGVEIYA